MAITDTVVPEFDQEMAATRRLLELVPDDRAGWRPHPKSKTLGGLAMHLVELPTRVSRILEGTSFEMAPGGSQSASRPAYSTRDDLLKRFDRAVADARTMLASRSDADLTVPWTLKQAGQDTLTAPRSAVLRTWILNHVIHHRGQLSVYLRLNDVAVPGIYGPTADDS